MPTRWTKEIKSKDYLIVLVCSNVEGSLEISLAIIGNSKNLPCFCMENPPHTIDSKTERGVINTLFSVHRIKIRHRHRSRQKKRR